MRLLIVFCFMAASVYAQTPKIEPGVSHELAKWRAAHYSDVRYKLNLTLEKMSPVLKGTLEIRVKVGGPGASGSPPSEGGVAAALGGRGGSLIVLDWRKIRGHEDKSTISNVSINGRDLSPAVSTTPSAEAAATPPIQEGSLKAPQTQNTFEEISEHLIFRDGVVAGENVIKLDFTSPILTSGSAITRYVDKEDGAEYIYSLFVPSDASTAFPVFDQPDLKARFTVRILAPNDWKVVSNARPSNIHEDYKQEPKDATSVTLEKSRVRIWTVNETKPISTYVFAFAAGPFHPFEEVSSFPGIVRPEIEPEPEEGNLDYHARIRPQIFVRKSQAAKFQPHATEVFRLNREGIKFLESYFDYKFPFPKYDIVLIPEFPFGGMEHAGATFLREDRVIFPQEPTKNDYITRANVIFHEAAHQWFGDTVTMKWFDDLWLKEGFAEFMAYKTLEKVMPEYNAWKVFYERNKQAAYLTDSTKGTTPIYQEIANLSAAKSAYGNIVYRKAPSFLKQAEFYIGPDKFQAAVRSFLKKHEFGNAGWEDLVKEFETVTNTGLQKWANEWITQRGLPIFRAKQVKTGSKIEISIRPADIFHENRVWSLKTVGLIRDEFDLPDFEMAFKTRNNVMLGWYKDLQWSHGETDYQFLFPNYKDYGYGIFLLDDKSRDFVLKNIQNEKDDFLRSMMWGSLWDSVREGELDPEEYVELVLRVQSASLSSSARDKSRTLEEDETTTATLLNRVSTAMTYYVSDKQRDEIGPRLESMLIDKMRTAPTLGQRITYYRALLNIGSTEDARRTLKRLLRESVPPAVAGGSDATTKNPPATAGGSDSRINLPLKTKDRFDIVTRLLILNDPEGQKLLADLEKTETSDEAKRYAYAARAGIATAENKAKYWNDFTANKEISESWIEAAFGPFNSVRHADLTLPYLQKALQELPNHKRNRKIFFVNGWLSAFIGGQKREEALAIVNKFLADNPNLDRDLRLKILENVDIIERAVKIRGKFATR